MQSISISELLLVIYVIVDDWYLSEGKKLLKGKAGKKPLFSDSEVITLMLAQDYIPYPGENQFIGYISANYLDLFPKILTQSQFNRRARSLRLLVERMRRYWLRNMGYMSKTDLLLDTKPVPVVGYKRSKKRSAFASSANYGHCASRKMKYFGYKLVMVCTLEGIPVVYELVPANTDERLAAESILYNLRGCCIYADKGFIGEDWQEKIFRHTRNSIFTSKRANQKKQNPAEFDRWLNSIRERVEGVFHEIQNTGRNIERLLAKTVTGLATRIISKMTSHLLKFILRKAHGIDVQTFTQTI
jgi:hypothetical protein